LLDVIFDVIITRYTYDTVSNIVITDPGLPDNNGKTSRDHFAIVFNARAATSAPVRKNVQFRRLKSINISELRRDIESSTIVQRASIIPDIDKLVDVYNSELESILDKHAPLGTKNYCTSSDVSLVY
jgi:hypothetical protein